MSLYFIAILIFAIMMLITILVWLFFANGIDKIKNPSEWNNKGSSGERILWLELTKKYKVPENQILRNVYIPTKHGTTEIDLIVVSKKGILVFECKNYAGRIYGDGAKSKWIQYIGRKKSYFLNPVLQNRGHVKRLQEFFLDIPSLPIIPFFVTTTNGEWKLKNINPADHVLFWSNVHFEEIYHQLPDSKIMAEKFNIILKRLQKLERPNKVIRQKHIDNLKKSSH